MNFFLKIIIMTTVAAVIFAKILETKQITGNNPTGYGVPPELAMLTNAIQSGLHLTQTKQPERMVTKRVCKIKSNGDEECKNIKTE